MARTKGPSGHTKQHSAVCSNGHSTALPRRFRMMIHIAQILGLPSCPLNPRSHSLSTQTPPVCLEVPLSAISWLSICLRVQQCPKPWWVLVFWQRNGIRLVLEYTQPLHHGSSLQSRHDCHQPTLLSFSSPFGPLAALGLGASAFAASAAHLEVDANPRTSAGRAVLNVKVASMSSV